jgi:hypothetical protein
MSMHKIYGGLVGSKVAIVTVPRERIETGDTAPVLASLERLIASREALEASNGTISLLVNGYDADPRELHLWIDHGLKDGLPSWMIVIQRLDRSTLD